MKRFLLLLPLLSGCFLNPSSPQIVCWYGKSFTPACADAAIHTLYGRTGRGWPDVEGPKFSSVSDMNAYVREHNLEFCGTNGSK